jgi:plasmid maintenance system killer protein
VAIRSFKNKTSEEINYGISSKQSRKLLPVELHEKARVKLARIGAATSLQDFQELRGNRFEVLKGDCSASAGNEHSRVSVTYNPHSHSITV